MKNTNDDFFIIAYCSYCKNPILSNEKYIIEDGKVYEIECYEQMNTYYDPMEEIEEY